MSLRKELSDFRNIYTWNLEYFRLRYRYIAIFKNRDDSSLFLLANNTAPILLKGPFYDYYIPISPRGYDTYKNYSIQITSSDGINFNESQAIEVKDVLAATSTAGISYYHNSFYGICLYTNHDIQISGGEIIYKANNFAVNKRDFDLIRRRNMSPDGDWFYSSNGKRYQSSFTLEMHKHVFSDYMSSYGLMNNLEELTITGSIVQSTAKVVIPGQNQLYNYMPNLRRLIIIPDEIWSNSGSELVEYISFGHYIFTGMDALEYLEIGKIGGPYFKGGGYFRNDSSFSSKYMVGTDAGLTLNLYMEQYRAAGGFMNSLAPTTVLNVYNYLTGEIMTE